MDGRSNTHYFGNSCTHTIYGRQNPWWRVDLGRVEPVKEVYVVSRSDCCDVLKQFAIRVGMLNFFCGVIVAVKAVNKRFQYH